MPSLLNSHGRFTVAALGVLSAWACSVVSKSDYTFSDSPSKGGSGGTSAKGGGSGKGGSAGKSNASGGMSGEAGTGATSGTGALAGESGAGGTAGTTGGKGGAAGKGGAGGKGGASGRGGKGGKGGTSATGGDSGAGQGGMGTSDCGDGNVNPGEQCDLGAKNGVTACTYGQMSCTVCNSDCTRAAGKPTYCGDSKIQTAHEECDDGNSVNETCTYGDQNCTGCDNSCKSLAAYCGDHKVNGRTLTGVKLEYLSACFYSDTPFFLNGVHLAGAASTPCYCTSAHGTVAYTDPSILAAVRPDDNLLEIRGVDSSYETLSQWARLTFTFDSGPDVVVTPIDPNGSAGTDNLCAGTIAVGYLSGKFDGIPIEQCDAATGCASCQTALPKSCAAILGADSSAPSGVYTIDPTGGASSDALPVYCDMTGGGTTYEALGFGNSVHTYAGYSVLTNYDFANTAVQQAFLWLYDMQGGVKNLEPGWVSDDCAYVDGNNFLKLNGAYVVPADLDDLGNQYHCNGTDETNAYIGNYTQPLMKFALYPPVQQTQTPPLLLNYFSANTLTSESADLSYEVLPAFFIKKY